MRDVHGVDRDAHGVDRLDGKLTERSAGESVDRQLLVGGSGAMLVGEVEDTHHPDFRGHVFVRWSRGDTCLARWLRCVIGAAPRRQDRVLLSQPANWPEPIVVAVLEGSSGAGTLAPVAAVRTLSLDQGETVRICDAQGTPLCEVVRSSQGAEIRLAGKDVDLNVVGKLRLRAEALELEGGRGGLDIRTEGDAVVRARFIRLN